MAKAPKKPMKPVKKPGKLPFPGAKPFPKKK